MMICRRGLHESCRARESRSKHVRAARASVLCAASALLPVALCGGLGTRLWPLSREHYRKHLLPLIGDDTTLQSTVRRVENMGGIIGEVLPPLVICNEEYRFLIAQQLNAGGRAEGASLVESCGRNTAPALTLAALL